MNFSEKIEKLAVEAEQNLISEFQVIDQLELFHSKNVLHAFQSCGLSESHFHATTGYGYGDIGRETIEHIFSLVLKAEDSLVRSQFISGTHALTVALFALLRPNEILLSITGKPYDTLDKVIGIVPNKSSLQAWNIKYEQIDLRQNTFDYVAIQNKLREKKIKVIEIQRSIGYSTRKTISIEELEKVIQVIREIDKEVIIMVDNCYCEFVEQKTPLEVGADIIVGSLIKNLGGGIAPNGAYIAGKKELIALASERLTVPGEGKEVGPTLGINKQILQGLFLAPSVVANSLKTAVFTSKIFEMLGYEVNPKSDEIRSDIVQMITFKDRQKLIRFCQGIQMGSPVDSFAIPEPWYMPGYQDQIIMASGSFTQGSSIELSCDGPIRSPYIAYLQGGLTYSYGKLGVMKAIDFLLQKNR